ncbi:hypothetical protein ACFWAY_51090 [Rhodococcus sp. NPDC059968]|uniref:hypothetical protein n=1 Tax=Rhodococcus sp. NPDC059968 TaxID=3347017 RepID=UPI00366EF60E
MVDVVAPASAPAPDAAATQDHTTIIGDIVFDLVAPLGLSWQEVWELLAHHCRRGLVATLSRSCGGLAAVYVV